MTGGGTRTGCAISPWRTLDRYQRSLVDHDKEATEHDLNWIERLIATEQAAQVSSPAPHLASGSTQAVDENPSAISNASVAHARPAFKRAVTERSNT